MPRRIIIDTDPGIDDAVAILLALASPEIEVLGLVAVAGNLPLAVTERNTRAIVELAGRPEIPVYAGCPRPMGRPLLTAERVHGDTGLGGLALPPPAIAARPEHGVDFLIETLRQAAPGSITLCALGPLTNIAVALVMAPEIAAGIAELVLMGGAARVPGNVTPAAEFNIHVDPYAAALVFDSGLPITMVPLDVELFGGSEASVAVETHSPLAAGMTVVDWCPTSGRAKNARVLETVDSDGFFRLLAERIARLP